MRFSRTAAETNGALLRLETVNPPTAVPEPVHVRLRIRPAPSSQRRTSARA
jgi:hypothetical protein